MRLHVFRSLLFYLSTPVFVHPRWSMLHHLQDPGSVLESLDAQRTILAKIKSCNTPRKAYTAIQLDNCILNFILIESMHQLILEHSNVCNALLTKVELLN